jgi:hypothetical protein
METEIISKQKKKLTSTYAHQQGNLPVLSLTLEVLTLQNEHSVTKPKNTSKINKF